MTLALRPTAPDTDTLCSPYKIPLLTSRPSVHGWWRKMQFNTNQGRREHTVSTLNCME